jgi:anti-sigma B factor antagonist
MEINEQQTDQCLILSIKGRLDTTNYNMLEKKLMEMIESNHHRILVECTGMDYISSSGLRILLMGLKKISQVKGKFVLCGLQENIHEIFEISGFSSIFEIYPTREEALKVF